MAIAIGSSVGRSAVNALPDVAAIGAALVAVGADNGGIFGIPLDLTGLGDAIAHFQSVQGLSAHPDGRVDPGGGTLRRINAILFPDEVGIRSWNAGLPATVGAPVYTPDETSLATDFVFSWTSCTGSGRLRCYQLDETVVPRWFGVLIPDGTTSFDRVHLFFHPTPAQAGYVDAAYHTPGAFAGILHYLTEGMATQFCAAGTGRVLVMPLMTQGAAGDCGMFPQRWPEIVGTILGREAMGTDHGAPFQRVSDVVVSSFSSGITYSHQFRARANLGSRLAGVIDFDGVISSYGSLSAAVTGPTGRVVRAQQSDAAPAALPALAAQNVFPLRRPRWGGPWAAYFDADPQKALLQIHGLIPQLLMQVAARRAG